jgi:NAD(P)-dependent dehydrogenase (short-subunit alcohol dehydrogenase family)
MELEGQTAIVTGAGRGIGRATALELARLGADIVVAELDRANAERTAAEVQALGRRASVVPTDVTSRADLTLMVERTRTMFGRIDILGEQRRYLPCGVVPRHHRGALGHGDEY